jgi:hypothetical protein
MLEYIFFNDGLREQFEEFVASLDLQCETRMDQLGTVVMLPENLPADTEDQLEDKYAELMEAQAALSDEESDVTQHQAVSIQVTMSDGSERMLKLDPETVNRLLECFTVEEMQELVNAIAVSLEKSGNGPLCQA